MDSIIQPKANDADQPGSSRKTPIRVGGVIALALLAGLVAWTLINRSGNDSATTTPSTIDLTSAVGPVAAPKDALTALAANVGHTVYWAGPIARLTPEFTKTSIGRVYVRYLPKGVRAGDKRSDLLIVATYPFPGAYGALKKQAKGKAVEIPGGGIAVVKEGYPQSVHFAFPGVAFEGEVYDPSPAQALEVATSGTIRPVP